MTIMKYLLLALASVGIISGAHAASLPITTHAQTAVLSPGQTGAESFNWSGYVATGSAYTGIGGTWTVPSVPTNSSLQADAAWVGIGGVSATDLIQAGTQDIVNPGGSVTYQAFYEVLPAASNVISTMSVNPGDSITASIAQTSAGEWTITIHNNTNGENFSTSISYQSSLSSAEWIEEMPTNGNTFIPLDNFGDVSFTNGYAVVNGAQTSIAGSGAQGLTMVNRSGQTLATASVLGSDEASFAVTRSSVVAQSAPNPTVIGNPGGAGRGRGQFRRVGIQGFVPGIRRTNINTSTGSTAINVNTMGTGTGSGQGFAVRFDFGGFGGNFRSILSQLSQFQAREGALMRQGGVLFRR